jgi:hypothetical protein
MNKKIILYDNSYNKFILNIKDDLNEEIIEENNNLIEQQINLNNKQQIKININSNNIKNNKNNNNKIKNLNINTNFNNKNLNVPKEFPLILKNYAKSVIRSNPKNIISFSVKYFEELKNNI